MKAASLLRCIARLGMATLGGVLLLALHPRFSGPASGVNVISSPERAGNISVRAELPFRLSALDGVFPVGRLISAAEYYVGQRNSAALREEMRGRSFGVTPLPKPGGREVYVLALGESSRPDRWQLAGQSRPTNPVLGREPNLVWLHDVVTPWTYTLAAVPVITTPKPAGDGSLFVLEKSILSLFREAGFRTYWISNQARPRNAASVTGQIASEADESRWTNAADAADDAPDGSYDEAVLAPLQEILGRGEMRQFIVLHLMGSHDAYHRRYPAAFNRFRPSLSDSPDANPHSAANRELVINSYDNSVLYTDYVLGRVIAALRGQDALAALYYVSDHGENLFDGFCPLIGHGGTARLNYPVSAFAWLSPRYMQRFPQVMPALQANARKRISTGNTFESMADLARIGYRSADRSRSIFSPSFREHRRLVHVGDSVVDWDAARFVGACGQPAEAG